MSFELISLTLSSLPLSFLPPHPPLSLSCRLVHDAVHQPGHQALVISLLSGQLQPIGNINQGESPLVYESLLSLLLPHNPSFQLFPNFSLTDQTSFISFCTGLSSPSYNLDQTVLHVAVPFIDSWIERAARSRTEGQGGLGGRSQLHASLQLIASWLDDCMSGSNGRSVHSNVVLVALSRCLCELWSQASDDDAAAFDPSGIDLCSSLIERIVSGLRKETIKAWESMRQLSCTEMTEAGEIQSEGKEGGGKTEEKAKVELLHDDINSLLYWCFVSSSSSSSSSSSPTSSQSIGHSINADVDEEVKRRLLRILLPALEAPLSLPPRPQQLTRSNYSWQSVEEWEGGCKSLRSFLQPPIRKERSEIDTVVDRHGGSTRWWIDTVVDMLWWCCVDEGHSKIMSSLMLSSASDDASDDEEEREEEREEEVEDLLILRATTKGVSGSLSRVVDRMILSSPQSSINHLLASSLAAVLPLCSSNQSQRLLGISLPSLISAYAQNEAEKWSKSLEGKADKVTAYSLHIMFHALSLVVDSAADVGRKLTSVCVPLDRCLSHLISHLKRSLVIMDAKIKDLSLVEGRSHWSLGLIALDQSLHCIGSIGNQGEECVDLGSLLALTLSIVQALCSPPPSLYSSPYQFKELIEKVAAIIRKGVSQGNSRLNAIRQVSMAAVQTADDCWRGIAMRDKNETDEWSSESLFDQMQ